MIIGKLGYISIQTIKKIFKIRIMPKVIIMVFFTSGLKKTAKITDKVIEITNATNAEAIPVNSHIGPG